MNVRKMMLGAALIAVVPALSANAQIRGSKHDFSTSAWSGGEICKPCHTPHFANPSAGALWNHALTSATYTLFDGASGTTADFDRVSRLCMSCHDGTVALDSFGGTTGSSTIADWAKIGTDLSNDHPIGKEAVYPTAGTAGRFNAAVTTTQGTSTIYTIAGPNATDSKLRLQKYTPAGGGADQWVVGCSTCHQVHNAGNFGNMLRFKNTASNLCLACHIK